METLLETYQAAEADLAPLQQRLDGGVDLSAEETQAAVVWALQQSAGERLKLLVEHLGVDAWLPDGRSLLRLAADGNNDAAIALLLDGGATLSAAAFEAAHHRPKALAILLERVDPNPDWPVPPLCQILSLYGSPNQVAALRLLARGADPSGRRKDGQSALHTAVRKRAHQVVLALIAAGADIDAADHRGQTALHAASALSPRHTRMLLEKGASVNASDEQGITPLHLAGCDATAQLLIAAGADMHAVATGRSGKQTVLWALMGRVSAQLVAQLLDGQKAPVGKSGLDAMLRSVATSSQADPETITLLLDRGANLEAKDGDGLTPLHVAVRCQNPIIGNALLDAGAMVDVTNKKDDSPIDTWVARIESSTPAMLAFGQRMMEIGFAPENTRWRVDRFVTQLGDTRAEIATFDWAALEDQLFERSTAHLRAFAEQQPTGPFAAFCFASAMEEGLVSLCLASREEYGAEDDVTTTESWLLQGFAHIDRDTDKPFNEAINRLEINGALEDRPHEALLLSLARVALRLRNLASELLSLTDDFRVFAVASNEPAKAVAERMVAAERSS